MIGDVGGETSTGLTLRIGGRENTELLESGLGQSSGHGPIAGKLFHPDLFAEFDSCAVS